MLKSKANWQFQRREVLENDIVSSILRDRGIETVEEMEQFLHPSLNDITNPASLNDIEKLKERVEHAIQAGEKIAVFGDYDADGVTATALMIKTLERMQANC